MSTSFSRVQIRKFTDIIPGTLAPLFGAVAGTAAASKAVVLDSSANSTGINALTVTTLNATNITGGTISGNVKKCTTQTNPATTGLIDITGLTGQVLVAGATYKFRCVISGLADATSGVSYAFTYTTATLTSIEYAAIMYTASAVSTTHGTTTTNSTLLADKAAALTLTVLEGTMVVNAGGTVNLQAATHTGTTAANIYVGSTMEFNRIS